jgi:hypothetical protein
MAIEPISQFYDKFHRYPGNNKQWWVAKVEVDDPDATPPVKQGDFNPEILDKMFTGNTRAPRGHFILNAFYKDRSSVSGISGLEKEITNDRPATAAFFSGRIWFACNSNVFYSQVLTDKHKAGLCYQEADPTSETISDLVATDGGVIPIPECTKIVRILPNAGGILVFGLNGVWNITGTADGFSAMDISVNKVSPVGCKSPMSVVETDTAVYWWSDVGILGMSQQSGMYGPIPGAFERSNISEDTIQSFYDGISDTAKMQAKGLYDAKANKVLWLYRDSEVSSAQYNRVLNLDLSLNAFYPWKIEHLPTEPNANIPYVKGFFVGERVNVISGTEDVTSDDVLVTAGGEPVTVSTFNTDISPSSVDFLTMKIERLRFAQANSDKFVDWYTENGVGVSYDSYVETGYELMNDAMRKKQITYILPFLRRTEEGWNGDEDAPELNNPSSCWMTIKFDWANSLTSNKWTTPVQVYKPGRMLAMPSSGEYDTGFPIVVSKHKVRGNGKSIQFRFGTSEPGRNFDLHGWSVALTGNTVP